MVGGALACIPTVLFAFIHSFTAGVVTAVVFAVYTQIENHVLNPVVMSKTVRINPLLVFIAVLAGASIGSLIGGIFGGFVAALLAIPTAGALQVLVKEVWQATAPDQPRESPAPAAEQQTSTATLPLTSTPSDRPGQRPELTTGIGPLSLFEPVRGSAPNIAGKGIANPMGAILAVGMMFEFLGWQPEAQAIDKAVRAALREGKTPAELGGTLSTREVGDWVANAIAKSGVAS